MTPRVARALAGSAAVLVAALAAGAAPRTTFTDVERLIANQHQLSDYADVPGSVADALPTGHYVSAATGQHVTFSDLVVTGRFTGWQPGQATTWSGQTGIHGRHVPWDDPRAETRTITLTLTVDTVVAPTTTDPGTHLDVTLTLPGNSSPEAVAGALTAGGEVIVFLSRTPDGWTIALDGALLGTVAPDHTITLGVLDQAPPGTLLPALAADAHGMTVADVAAAGPASARPRT
ncbi:MAG: hypothetical protein FWF90_08740 [Promicromonosporaceae bacterium]|nr:hypothetical protein [Promicromonosporaceae bacterium]